MPKLVIKQTQALALTESFRRIYKLCRAQRLARREQLRVLDREGAIVIMLSMGAIEDCLMALTELTTTAPDANSNYVLNKPRRIILSILGVVAGRIKLLEGQIIPAYKEKALKGETGLEKYLTKAVDRVTFLREVEAACNRVI